MTSLNSAGGEPRPMPKMVANKKPASSSVGDMSEPEPDDLSIVELYQAARDENELLEFKNYELQFKIQELEQNQKRILSAICSNVTSSSPADSTTTTPANGDVGASAEASPPTRNSSPGVELAAASCGGLREEQSRQPVDTNPPAESDSRAAKQQCANYWAGQVTSRLGGDRAPIQVDGDGDADANADGHQFDEGLPAPQDATRRHANESGALSSAAGGGGVPSGEQSDAPPMAAGRCQAKVDQLQQQQWPRQLPLVEHENINNEPCQQDERLHDKYAPPSPRGELEDVARKTNRRSREPEAAAHRKPAHCPHGAPLIEYNGAAPTQQHDQPASGQLHTGGLMPADSPLGGLPASDSAHSLLQVGAQLCSGLRQNSLQSETSRAEAMSESVVGANQAPVRRLAGARIAMPVQRRVPLAQQSFSQKNAKATSASHQSASKPINSRGAAARPPNLADPLRSGSKWSLEQKSIGRAPDRQPQWQRPASLRRATSTKQVSGSQQWAVDQAPTVRLSRAASSGQLSGGRKQQSANSFVTHIPTLIGASHAPTGATTSSSSSSNSAMMRRIMRSRRPTANRLADSSAKSKSLSNLVASDELDGAPQSAHHVTGERPTSMHGDGRVRVQPASLSASESSRSMGELATEANRPVEAPISQCSKCQSYQNKADKLLEDCKQLREQISELEELENDSRLMSQNLAQQLVAMEKKLDKSKLELQRATESESKLRFQNKRLHFELRQRQDCVGQLEHQMNELRSRARTLLRLQRSDSSTSRKQPVPTSQLDEAKQKYLPLAHSKSTGSSSAEESDSAMDELGREKRLSLESAAASSSSEAQARHQDKPLASSVSYDSAYSKSSSSSDANSSTNSEADCTEHCAQSSACVSSSTDELDSNQSAVEWTSNKQQVKSVESGDTCERLAFGAGSESVDSARATRESILSPSDRPDKSATVCPQPAQHERKPLDSGSLSKNTQIDAIGDCVSQETEDRASVERHSAPLGRISTPTWEQTDNQQQQQQQQQEAAKHKRSSIELALEGVEELEKVRDRELEQFLAGRREALPTKVAFVRGGQEGGKVTENGIGLAPTRSTQLHEQQQQQESWPSSGQLDELIGGLKREVSSLKMRLVQANTLNDNLIRELKAQQSSVTSGCKGQLEPEGGRRSVSLELPAQRPPATTSCLVQLNNLAQSNGANARHSWNHQGIQAAGQPDAASLPTGARRRSSVIYVNGVSASVTHHHHHYDRLQKQTKAGQPDDHDADQSQQQSQQSQPPATLAGCSNCCFHRHQTSDRYLAASMQQQLVEWLRFLLDKLHFHHGRTFELVSECQKFAMNALLASYNRQLRLLHHERAVKAGNQAIRRAASGEQQQSVSTGRVVIEKCTPLPATIGDTSSSLYPVQPPPRQRAGSANRSLSQKAPHEINPLATLDSPASVTALQVAKQSLSSLVPIYYSCNKQQKQPPHQANTGQQKLSLELEGRASKSAAPFASDNNNFSRAHNTPELLGKPADIYATVNKANKRPLLMGAISVLEIGNIKQKQQDLTSSQLMTGNGVDVVPIEPAISQKLQISSGSNGQQLGATTAPTSGVFKSINQQQRQLAGVRNSLSEDMERFRVHSNGQLLDLLMRQNWCESVISEKIKSMDLGPRHA